MNGELMVDRVNGFPVIGSFRFKGTEKYSAGRIVLIAYGHNRFAVAIQTYTEPSEITPEFFSGIEYAYDRFTELIKHLVPQTQRKELVYP